jgi:hypothetical protein
MFRLITVLRALVVSLALSACVHTSGGPVVALPNGYYLHPTANGETEIVKRNGRRVLKGPVAAYAVRGRLVAGALGQPPLLGRAYANDLPFEGTPDTRYFVLDTASGKLDTDLDAAEWRRRLEAVSISPSLAIYSPLPWPESRSARQIGIR